MKTILFTLLAIPSISLAADSLELTSWVQLNPDNRSDRAGEICGKVTGELNGTERILLTVDPGKRQGEYVAFVAPSGKFCHVVASYSGKLEAQIIGTNIKVSLEK